jgi:lysophospholipase L1-like esterase
MTSVDISITASIPDHTMGRRTSWTRRQRRRAWAVATLLALTTGCGGSDPDVSSSGADDAGATSSDTDAPAPGTAAPGSDPADSGDDTAVPATDDAASGTDAEPGGAAATELGDGPVTVVALGDSLTYGEGDETGLGGFVGRLTESIGAMPGREGSTLANLGVSGWTSSGMVDGQDGSPAQLPAAVEAVQSAMAEGRAVLATVLIGSNDMWYLYAFGSPEGTTPAEEDAAAEVFRSNLERTVTDLTQAGAVVVLGLPDDQSLRPASVQLEVLQSMLPDVSVEEIQLMSAMSTRLGAVVEEVAAAHGLRTVDTNAPFWADTSTMAPDLIHPNGAGYAILADLWLPVITGLL